MHHHRQIISVLFLGLILWLAKLVYLKFEEEAHSTIVLQQVTAVDSGRQEQLPLNWLGPVREIAQRHFEVTFNLPKSDSSTPFLYLPRYEQALEVSLNGVPIKSSALHQIWSGPLHFNSALIAIPEGVLQQEQNRLLLTVTTGPLLPPGSLSKIYIGRWEALSKLYHFRQFFEVQTRWLSLGVMITLFLVNLILYLSLSTERIFGWMAITFGVTLLFRVGMLAQLIPEAALWTPYLFLLAPIAGLSYLAASIELGNQRASSAWLLTGVTISALSYLLLWQTDLSIRDLGLMIAAPTLLLAILSASLLLVLHAWKHPSTETTLLFSGSLLLAAGVAHDMLARKGMLDADFMLAHISILIVVIGFTTFIMRRLARMANTLRHSKQNLKQRLTEREAELHQLFDEKQRLAEQAAMTHERNRITSELHDGVAGHLSTIIALSETTSSNKEIRSTARFALDELRMIIEAFSSENSDLYLVLATVRERCFNPLEQLGIELQWSIRDLPEVIHLKPDDTLNLLRILQEALSNALHHGAPKQITVTGNYRDGRILIEVSNHQGTAFQTGSRGHGLQNMRRRAESLPDGELHITPLEDGARITLSFRPIGDPSSSPAKA